jgi:hypothetical protein
MKNKNLSLCLWACNWPVLVLLIGCCMASQQVHAQTDTTALRNREFGISLSNIRFLHIGSQPNSQNETSSSFRNIGPQLFYLKTNANQVFVRVGIGMNLLLSSSTGLTYRDTTTIWRTNRNNRSSISFFGGFGKQFAGKNRPFWGRFRGRLGVGVGGHVQVAGRGISHFEEYGPTGNLVTETTYSQRVGGQTLLNPMIFGQLEFRLFKQCYLGAELGFGPIVKFTYGRNASWIGNMINPTAISSSNLGFSFEWPHAINIPTLSLGYSF